jgi:pyruvate formate lyase activating enzyme
MSFFSKILLRKTSFVDYPGRISSVFFFTGCNLRCPWCYNRELVTGRAENLVSVEDGLNHIRKRRSVLGGVVLSGGEPCLCNELPDIVSEIKKISLPVKLDTNGTMPAMLEKLFSRDETRPDYIALDLKLAPLRYGELAAQNHGDNLVQSAALICGAGIAHEYRTLALPGGFITGKDIEALSPLAGDAPWHFRPFRGGNCLDPAWDNLEESEKEAENQVRTLVKTLENLRKGIKLTNF